MTAEPKETEVQASKPAPRNLKRVTPEERPIVIQFQAAAAPTGPKAPKRVEWIHLSDTHGHPYANHKILARIRYPDTLNADFGSEDFAVIKKALRQIVLEHNDWLDPDSDDDKPLPPATDDAFWDSLAQEEILLMLRAVGGERGKSLSSLLETKND